MRVFVCLLSFNACPDSCSPHIEDLFYFTHTQLTVFTFKGKKDRNQKKKVERNKPKQTKNVRKKRKSILILYFSIVTDSLINTLL